MFCVHCVIHSKRTTTPTPSGAGWREGSAAGRPAGDTLKPHPQDLMVEGCWICSADGCFGGHSGGETPGLIPNPEAKPSSADGTALGRVWESRTPPDST